MPTIQRKVALVVYDPLDSATGKRLSETYGWWGADQLEAHTDELAAAILGATAGHVDFQVWLAHIPRASGSHSAGGATVANDWWPYILCYSASCS